MPQPLHESTTLTEATASADAVSGVLEVEFITAGWGSSGYYSRDVVEAAAPLFEVGTHLYFDHPSATEATDRPERSVRDLAAVVTEAGTFNATTGGVRGKVKPLAPYRELLTDEAFTQNVGLSIRGSASDITIGEAEGRTGPIVEGLADISSVDFVTRAGRGGRVLQVLESATDEQVTARAVARGIEEATADERRTQLSDAVRSAYGSENSYAWVQDFDDTTVWFQASADNERGRYWEQAYTPAEDDLTVSLTGERTEVRQVTRYLPITTPIVPVTRPDSTNPTTEADQEVTMGNIQIEESEHTRLVERAGRVDTLETERDTAVQERDTARAAIAERDRADRARTIVTECATTANVAFTPLEERGLLAQIPTSDDGSLNEAAFTTLVTEAAATVAASRGAGTVSGYGGTGGPATVEVTESDVDNAVAGTFGRQVKEA
jgi:hypothetical protein